MPSEVPPKEKSYSRIRVESDLSLEVVILLVLGVFMLLFGIVLFKIHTGELPYTPDSTYGLFLIIVSFQIVTMGKTPFGDMRRSWAIVTIGICTAIIGMTACFIPGTLTEIVRILVGLMLFVGGISLLLQLLLSENKAKTWMKTSKLLQHLTLACGLVYTVAIALGLITLLPGITIDPVTAVLLIIYGISIFYLAGCIQKVSQLYPPEKFPELNTTDSKGGFRLLKEASISLSLAVLIMLGVLLVLLGALLFPINQGVIPFSADGELGLLLVIMAIQMTALGETPVGEYKRSWLLVSIGIIFTALGAFACIVPGILTSTLQILLGTLNILGGVILLFKRFFPILQEMRHPPSEPVVLPSILKKMLITQTILNIVAIAFGLSMLLPGLIPTMLVPGIVIINGLLLFVLGYMLQQITKIEEETTPTETI
ncbi:MAG: hypothetical protein A4E25_00804 [Methanobacterium sp. PtaB.Bin024]|nr:MAG: hypothetical protein A4E25_00804 [Methanobacterium sp. PtaB.Bin024]